MSDLYERAPKVELHLHLEGAPPIETLWQLVDHYGDENIRSIDDLRDLFEYRDFPHFIETWFWMTKFLRTAEDFELVASAVGRSLAEQNIIYAEASISPADFAKHGLSVGEIATAVRTGLSSPGTAPVGLLVDLVRDTGPEEALRVAQQTVEVAGEAGIVGITIGGSEQDFPPALFREAYRVAEREGLGLTAHAGEAAGAKSVWSALNDLGVSRIGHGVRSVEDPALLDHLVERRIPLEVCPSSNLRTGVVDSWEQHPVFELLERGVNVTVSSDDPLFFGNSVAGDLRAMAELADIDVAGLTNAAIEASWAGEQRKRQMRHEVVEWWDQP